MYIYLSIYIYIYIYIYILLLPLPRPHDEVTQRREVRVGGLRREGVAPRVFAQVDVDTRVEVGVSGADHLLKEKRKEKKT